jgi:hypothetical protein
MVPCQPASFGELCPSNAGFVWDACGAKLDAELPPSAKRTWLTVVHQSLLGLIQPRQVSCIWL